MPSSLSNTLKKNVVLPNIQISPNYSTNTVEYKFGNTSSWKQKSASHFLDNTVNRMSDSEAAPVARPFHMAGVWRWRMEYVCFPARRMDVDSGGKIILPPSAIHQMDRLVVVTELGW